ncbi:MAG TPA: porin family protein [Chitinophagaceae bacterium]|nr:porin family protein [Chitinophagaceae bacterium]
MKKVSLFTLLLSTSFALFAQDQPQLRTKMDVKPRFGVRGGVNLASLEIDDDYNGTPDFKTNSKTSFQLGAFVNIPLGGMLRIQPELSYQGGGSKINGSLITNTAQVEDYELDFDYLAVPVMFQLQTNGGFFVEAGPQFAFLTTAREDRATGTDVDIKDQEFVKKTDFALAAGLGYLSRIGLGLNARYVHGLTNVYNTERTQGNQNEREVSNRGVQIGLVYHFGAAK